MTARTLLITAAMAGAALGLAGCGGSSTGAAGSAPASPPATSAGMSPSSMSSGMSSSMAPSSMAPSMAPSGSGMSSSSQPAAAKATITIKDYKYQTPASVAPGARITVTNDDSVNHTVTAKDKSLFNVLAKSNSRTTFTAPTKPGKYPFGCNFHAQMHGVLVVT